MEDKAYDVLDRFAVENRCVNIHTPFTVTLQTKSDFGTPSVTTVTAVPGSVGVYNCNITHNVLKLVLPVCPDGETNTYHMAALLELGRHFTDFKNKVVCWNIQRVKRDDYVALSTYAIYALMEMLYRLDEPGVNYRLLSSIGETEHVDIRKSLKTIVDLNDIDFKMIISYILDRASSLVDEKLMRYVSRVNPVDVPSMLDVLHQACVYLGCSIKELPDKLNEDGRVMD